MLGAGRAAARRQQRAARLEQGPPCFGRMGPSQEVFCGPNRQAAQALVPKPLRDGAYNVVAKEDLQ